MALNCMTYGGLSQAELRTLLSQKQVIQSPVRQIAGGNFARTVTMKDVIGVDAKSGLETRELTVVSNSSGELKSTFPGSLQ